MSALRITKCTFLYVAPGNGGKRQGPTFRILPEWHHLVKDFFASQADRRDFAAFLFEVGAPRRKLQLSLSNLSLVRVTLFLAQVAPPVAVVARKKCPLAVAVVELLAPLGSLQARVDTVRHRLPSVVQRFAFVPTLVPVGAQKISERVAIVAAYLCGWHGHAEPASRRTVSPGFHHVFCAGHVVGGHGPLPGWPGYAGLYGPAVRAQRNEIPQHGHAHRGPLRCFRGRHKLVGAPTGVSHVQHRRQRAENECHHEKKSDNALEAEGTQQHGADEQHDGAVENDRREIHLVGMPVRIDALMREQHDERPDEGGDLSELRGT